MALGATESKMLTLVGLESCASCINRCSIYEPLYLTSQQSDAAKQLEGTLIEFYAVILAFQAFSIKQFASKTPGTVLGCS